MSTNIVSTGGTSIGEQLQDLVGALWKKLIDYLDSKGLKEPLERYYVQFKGLPFAKRYIQELVDQKIIGRVGDIRGSKESDSNQETPHIEMEALQKATNSGGMDIKINESARISQTNSNNQNGSSSTAEQPQSVGPNKILEEKVGMMTIKEETTTTAY